MESETRRPSLVVLVGPQGSGKSTFCRERLGSLALVSKDRMPNCRNRERRQTRLIEESLRRGASVVVDNTNPTPAVRENLVRLGRVAGARVVAYWFSTELATCLARNAARTGRALVPPGILVQTHARTVRPTRAEGFDEVYHVRLGPGGYEIWPEVTEALAAR